MGRQNHWHLLGGVGTPRLCTVRSRLHRNRSLQAESFGSDFFHCGPPQIKPRSLKLAPLRVRRAHNFFNISWISNSLDLMNHGKTIETIVEPIVEPIIEATIDPAIRPNVEPNVEPNIEPHVEGRARSRTKRRTNRRPPPNLPNLTTIWAFGGVPWGTRRTAECLGTPFPLAK